MVLSRLVRLSVALLVSLTSVVASPPGIYPDDHWSYSTKLTTSKYAEAIQTEIDNGKTVFVRFIATEVGHMEIRSDCFGAFLHNILLSDCVIGSVIFMLTCVALVLVSYISAITQ